ncbi:MAG: TIGR01777 family oxidoreductase [Draconibacterium sp.]
MNIKITGQSGYLGSVITKELSARGHIVTAISRNALYGDVDLLKDKLSNADVIIHLAGSPILTRWNTKNKLIITESRVVTTQNLVKAIKKLNPDARPKKFIQASAIGIYKAFENHNENSQSFDKGFVGKVVQQWEKASEDLPDEINRTILRIGLVIGKKAKTITNLLLPFQLGLGAKIGNGKQPFPFIHDADVAGAFLWVTENDSASGIYNLVAPQQISNRDFTKALAKTLNRPAIFAIPEFVLKLVLGEAALLLTDIPCVIPENLISAGFEFRYPDIESALKEIIA